MKIERSRPPDHVDARGTISDVLLAPVEHVALFTCAAGSVRGGHYHVRSTAYIYVLSGTLGYYWRAADGAREAATLHVGDLLTIEPGERHSLVADVDSSFLMLTHGPDGGQQHLNDTVREDV